MHNGALKESTNLVFLIHGEFVTLAKRQYFGWLFFFFLSGHKIEFTEREFFHVVIQHSVWCKGGFERKHRTATYFSTKHQQVTCKVD